MRFRDADRGQAIQVGAVLLFAVLILAFSSYQAVIIPADNQRVEFNHNQEVQEQLADLRTALLSMPDSASARSVTVALGTQYPSRTLGLNPNPPGGSLQTVGTTDAMVNLTIDNAVVDGEAGDYWDGDPEIYDTGAIEYSPIYNRYGDAPTTTYEHSLLYNDFPSGNTLVLANQTLVEGNRLSILTVNGSLDRTASRSTSVDVRPISSSSETVTVEAESQNDPITLTFASGLTADRWRHILSDENVTVTGGDPIADGEFNEIQVELERDDYTLQMTEAAVGQGATGTSEAYLTDVAGGDGTVAQGSSHDVTLAVRDRYNNPVSGVDVTSSVDDSPRTTNADGEVTFTYDATGASEGEKRLNFTTGDAGAVSSSSFDSSTTENVTTTVDVTTGGSGGGGAYDVNWVAPSDDDENPGAIFDDCDEEQCTWDVGASNDDTLDLNATLDPAFEDIDLEFAVTNTTVAELDDREGTTGTNGAANETLTANANGTVDVLASGNEGSDEIEVEIIGMGDGGGGTIADTVQYVTNSGSAARSGGESRLDLDIEHTGGSAATITDISIDSDANNLGSIYEGNGGSGAGQHEVYIDSSSPGNYEDGDVDDYYSLGDTQELTQDATLQNGDMAQVTILDFRDNDDQPASVADTEVTITLTFQDDSTYTFSFTPPGN